MSSNLLLVYTLDTMKLFLWVVLITDLVAILLVLSLKLDEYKLSKFAFSKYLETVALKNHSQSRSLYKNIVLVRVGLLVKLVGLFTLSVTLWVYLVGPILGFTYSLISLLILSLISKIRFFQIRSKILFEKNLDFILKVIKLFSPILRLVKFDESQGANLPGSYDEFIDQLNHVSDQVINGNQKNRINSVLSSQKLIVKDIMTTKKKVITVDPSATLGPIVLSDLSKTKHGYFLVSSKKAEPEGILKLSELGDINLAKKSTAVRDFMTTHMVYIDQDESLDQLIQTLLTEKEYFIIVKNSDQEYVGIVTVADLMKSLIGVSQEE